MYDIKRTKKFQGLLKQQLSQVQSHVLETRQLLDLRRHYDSEVNRWISSIKADLTQVEFVAQVSHQGNFSKPKLNSEKMWKITWT